MASADCLSYLKVGLFPTPKEGRCFCFGFTFLFVLYVCVFFWWGGWGILFLISTALWSENININLFDFLLSETLLIFFVAQNMPIFCDYSYSMCWENIHILKKSTCRNYSNSSLRIWIWEMKSYWTLSIVIFVSSKLHNTLFLQCIWFLLLSTELLITQQLEPPLPLTRRSKTSVI